MDIIRNVSTALQEQLGDELDEEYGKSFGSAGIQGIFPGKAGTMKPDA